MSKTRFFCLLAAIVMLTSCAKPTSAPVAASTASLVVAAPGVQLASSKVEAGQATEAQLKQGLQSAAETLSALCAESRKTHPELKGHLRGTFHIEQDGTPRMFLDGGSEFTPADLQKITDDFVGATFSKKWKFPPIGNDLLLTIDFAVE